MALFNRRVSINPRPGPNFFICPVPRLLLVFFITSPTTRRLPKSENFLQSKVHLHDQPAPATDPGRSPEPKDVLNGACQLQKSEPFYLTSPDTW